MAYARRERAAWRSWAAIAEHLGVAEETVRRWCSGRQRKRAVVPVEIVEAMGQQTRDTSAHGLAVVSPAGYRVEGLDVDVAARLLRALG